MNCEKNSFKRGSYVDGQLSISEIQKKNNEKRLGLQKEKKGENGLLQDKISSDDIKSYDLEKQLEVILEESNNLDQEYKVFEDTGYGKEIYAMAEEFNSLDQKDRTQEVISNYIDHAKEILKNAKREKPNNIISRVEEVDGEEVKIPISEAAAKNRQVRRDIESNVNLKSQLKKIQCLELAKQANPEEINLAEFETIQKRTRIELILKDQLGLKDLPIEQFNRVISNLLELNIDDHSLEESIYKLSADDKEGLVASTKSLTADRVSQFLKLLSERSDGVIINTEFDKEDNNLLTDIKKAHNLEKEALKIDHDTDPANLTFVSTAPLTAKELEYQIMMSSKQIVNLQKQLDDERDCLVRLTSYYAKLNEER